MTVFYMFRIYKFYFFSDLLFWSFWLWYLSFLNTYHAMIIMKYVYFWKIYNIHDHTWPCILLTFFGWGDSSELNVESLIMILFSAYLASLSPPFSGSLTSLLWSSHTDTWSNNFGKFCGMVWPSMFTLRRSLKISDCTTCRWCIIQL